MDFRHYKFNVQDFLQNYYSDLKKIKIGASEVAVNKFLKNELSRINSYTIGVFKEIILNAEDIIEEKYSVEMAERVIEKYKKQLPKINFSPMKTETIKEISNNEMLDRPKVVKNYEEKREIGKSLTREQKNKIKSAGATGGIVGFGSSLLIGPPGIIKMVFFTSSTALIFVGAVLIAYTVMDEKGQDKITIVKQEFEDETKIVLQDEEGAKRVTYNSLEPLLNLRRKEVEKKILDGIDEAERIFNQLMSEAIAQ